MFLIDTEDKEKELDFLLTICEKAITIKKEQEEIMKATQKRIEEIKEQIERSKRP